MYGSADNDKVYVYGSADNDKFYVYGSANNDRYFMCMGPLIMIDISSVWVH